MVAPPGVGIFVFMSCYSGTSGNKGESFKANWDPRHWSLELLVSAASTGTHGDRDRSRRRVEKMGYRYRTSQKSIPHFKVGNGLWGLLWGDGWNILTLGNLVPSLEKDWQS